jgi:quinol monooxygenase YgiN
MSNIIELRQYTLKPGRRDTLIDLFEREFIESQEATGMELIGQFRDLDNPDRFVWLRGFPDMESRARSLAEFYGGPVWKSYREAANATMIDSGNVLLLRPAWSGAAFANLSVRPHEKAAGIVIAPICYFDAPASAAFIHAFRETMPPLIKTAGATVAGVLVTESSANTFPALPVREGENVFVWFALFQEAEKASALPFPQELKGMLARPPEILRLQPTPHSRLRA